MALKICSECGATVASSARACPSCGNVRKALVGGPTWSALFEKNAVKDSPSASLDPVATAFLGGFVVFVLISGGIASGVMHYQQNAKNAKEAAEAAFKAQYMPYETLYQYHKSAAEAAEKSRISEVQLLAELTEREKASKIASDEATLQDYNAALLASKVKGSELAIARDKSKIAETSKITAQQELKSAEFYRANSFAYLASLEPAKIYHLKASTAYQDLVQAIKANPTSDYTELVAVATATGKKADSYAKKNTGPVRDRLCRGTRQQKSCIRIKGATGQ